jgi:nitric oxide reductase subunit B
VLQLLDVLKNGYWHARSPEYLNQGITLFIEWIRLPADAVFIVLGVLPALIAVGRTYQFVRKS